MCTDDYKWHYDYVRLAWDAGFLFDKYKYPNLDKNKICLIDIDRIIKERDVASVERFLPTVVQYILENDQTELLDTNFVKMFRMGQLSVEYLLFCKKYLDNTVALLKKDISKLREENRELKLFSEELETHISKHNLVTFKCDKCPKAFSSEEYLNGHVKRRHNNENRLLMSTETDQLQSEIKQLKERLNATEKLLQEKEEKSQNAKTEKDVNEVESKLQVDEILEKFEKFKEKVESDLEILQKEKNFYEEKYSKLFDFMLQSNKKHINNTLIQESQSVNKIEERNLTRSSTDRIEITTQTETENVPPKKLHIESVHDRNVFEFKNLDTNIENDKMENNLEETIERKISQFEEQIELKISSGLTNIGKQMEAFWEKFSEIELKRDTNTLKEIEENSPQQEIVQIEAAKPKIKPRMKLSKPTTFMSPNEENAKMLKTEIEKMHIEPVITEVMVKKVESKLIQIPSIMYDSSSSSSESEMKSNVEIKSESDSESSAVQVLPKKSQEAKPSTSTLGKHSIRSLKKVAQSEEAKTKLRKEATNVINNRLQDMGISPSWKGLPQRTFQKAMKIVQHQADLVKKSYPNYDSIKKSIQKSLNKRVAKKIKSKKSKPPDKQGTNVINIRYRKKSKDLESEIETKPSIVTIKNRSLYNTDSESEEERPVQLLTSKISEAVPSYSAVIQELRMSQTKNMDTDSDINSIILPNEDMLSEIHTKSALKNYPSIGSLTKKKVLFDIESDKIGENRANADQEKRNSITSIDSSDIVKEIDNDKKQKKNDSSLSDFDFSEL